MRCIVCALEELPAAAAEPINTRWVCVCGALYRIVSIPGEGQQWAHLENLTELEQQPTAEPDRGMLPIIPLTHDSTLFRKEELEAVIREYIETYGGDNPLVKSLQTRFELPAIERIEVRLIVEIPSVGANQTALPIADRVAEHLTTMTAPTIARTITKAVRQ